MKEDSRTRKEAMQPTIEEMLTPASMTLVKPKPGMKVLFMSGHADTVISERIILEKDTPFIRKPFTIESLTRKVREILDLEH